jgi:hypothetical protein
VVVSTAPPLRPPPPPPKAVVLWSGFALDVPVRSSLLHLKIARVPCRWLFPQRPLQSASQLGRGWDGGGVGVDCEVHANLCTTPLMENVTTIMNSIGRSSDPSSHLPHTCGLRWTLNVLRHTAASERELPTTADPPDHEVPATGAHKSDVPQLSTPKIRNWQRGVEKCIASRA